MLNPFKIRELNGPSSVGTECSSSSHGVVQISASGYDDLVSSHPRATLTYLDEDDGDQITVGSSLELGQRLDEPLDMQPRLDAIQLSEDDRGPMHIFDIRRSKSITDLWKQFEINSSTSSQPHETRDNVTVVAEPAVNTAGQGDPAAANTSATAAPGDISQPPLLAAFEAELANILDSSEEPAESAPQPEPFPAAESARNTGSREFPGFIENLACDIFQNLLNGAKMVESELRVRLPELQRQVRDAQRHLPANMGNTLQGMLSNLEARLRTAFNNIPDNGRQWADNGRHWAEEAFHAGRPVAENAAESLRMMASEVNGVGRSFLTAFEQELARATSHPMNMASGLQNPPSPFSYPTGSTTAPPVNTRNTETRSTTSESARAPPQNWTHLAPSESLHSGFLNRSSSYSAGDIGPKESQSKKQASDVPPAPAVPRATPYSPTPPFSSLPWWPSIPQYGGYFPSSVWPRGSSMPFGQNTPQVPNIDANAIPENPSEEIPITTASQVEDSGRKTLFIGNIGFKVTERTIQDVFASKGFIVDVDLPLDVGSGQHAGFGYLHFPSVHPAIAAMDALQGAHIDGHAINLEYIDAAPIDSVGSETATDNPMLFSTSVQGKDKGSTELNQPPVTQMKRRKSVTFKDAPPTDDRPIANKSSDPKTAPNSSTDDALSALLIDLSMDNSTTTSGPFFSSSSNEPSRRDHDDPFDPEVQLRRFPPVSQLEAQVLANQRQHESHSTPLRRSRTVSYTGGEGHQNDSGGINLRRANTTLLGQPRTRQLSHSSQAEESHFPRLARHASERRLSRGFAAEESDAWGRLDKRARKRSTSRPSSRHSIPGSFPAEEPPTSTSSDADLERCVSSLIDMGYGTAEDGGRSRMAVYAAASNNDLMDAIEMIEEERKAYGRHR